MDHKDFISETIATFDNESFELVKRALVGEYFRFHFVEDSSITKELLADKACDYFEIVEQKSFKPFDKLITSYANDLRSIIERRVAETPRQRRKDTDPVEVPRARMYYEKAGDILQSRNLTVRNLIDYTRIMMCLYMSIIENDYKTIHNLDFSADKLDNNRIISSMKNERKPGARRNSSRTLFNLEDTYGMDTCTFIMTIILLQTIANERG